MLKLGIRYTIFNDYPRRNLDIRRSIRVLSKRKKRHQETKKLYIALLAVCISIVSISVVTYAWYIYHTNARTTRVQMVAGTSISLLIANQEDGDYSSSTVLEEFQGKLNPVSTNRIGGGFQKVLGFTNGSEMQTNVVANLFGEGEEYRDYYQTTIYLKTDESALDLAIGDIGFDDVKGEQPVSTAIRVGFVNPATKEEFIYEINQDENPNQEYNTQQGEQGHVLDSDNKGGSTTVFTPLNQENYCEYDNQTGIVTTQEQTKVLMRVNATPQPLKLYIWLEGCDEDCTNSLSRGILKNLAISFCGISVNERG